MKTYTYSNKFDTYEIIKFNNKWVISQDGIYADGYYKTLKDAKKAIDNQEVYF